MQVGTVVLYRWRPGQVRAGQTESAAMITKINADGTVNLTVYPDGTPDPLFLKNVPPHSQEVSHHCYEPSTASVAELEARVAQLESDLLEMVDRLPKRRAV